MTTDQHSPDHLDLAEATPDLEFTGERIVPGKTDEALFREHEERYVFAGQYVMGADVLDVACGSGVGTSLLQRAGARSALGLDIDRQAIAYARARYRDCAFAECDAQSLCLLDDSADVVVSFETLEHVLDQERFLRECHRVLRPGGMLVCSTPNLNVSRWGTTNPHHLRELNPRDFRDLLTNIFPSVELFSQRNRSLLLYVPRKTVRRGLQRLRCLDLAEKILGRRPTAGSFRSDFVNDIPSIKGNISSYNGEFLKQPTFLIAVARKAPI